MKSRYSWIHNAGAAIAALASVCTPMHTQAQDGWVLDVEHNVAPEGFVALFDGSTLDGWKGLVANPIKRAEMSADELAKAQAKSDEQIAAHWWVEDGEIVNDGHGPHLCTDRAYGDFEMFIEWKISPGADSGIYLRGTPQIQIWDPVDGIEQAKVGSGGLYNNQKNVSKPLTVADNPAGEWNHFHVRMIGDHVRVALNGVLVTDDVVMENYWDRSRPIFAREQIELQTHGGEIRFRNIYLREIDATEANAWLASRGDRSFRPLFNGTNLDGWIGSTGGYLVQPGGVLMCDPKSGGNLLTKQTFSDFVLRFEFKLPPGGNNGLAVRTPPQGNPAYEGLELQILDNTAPKFARLQPYQYHGSIYGVVPAIRGYQRPVGAWNFQEVICHGPRVRVNLNGTTIVDADLSTIDQPIDGQNHPGLSRSSGHLGFMGHGDAVEFRNIRISEIK